MIYTIGHRANYRKAILKHGSITKLPDGYAFLTEKDAQRRIDELEMADYWCVWGLNANWEQDTKPEPTGGWWHVLINEVDIIALPEEA